MKKNEEKFEITSDGIKFLEGLLAGAKEVAKTANERVDNLEKQMAKLGWELEEMERI